MGHARCVVPSCCFHATGNVFKGLVFHSFPFKKKGLLDKWLDSLQLRNAILHKSAVVCASHFKDEQYMNPANRSSGLRSDAVPYEHEVTIFVPVNTNESFCCKTPAHKNVVTEENIAPLSTIPDQLEPVSDSLSNSHEEVQLAASGHIEPQHALGEDAPEPELGARGIEVEYNHRHIQDERRKHVECCVYGCMNSKRKGTNVSFHVMPEENLERRKAWLSALGLANVSPSKRLYVCSNHFSPDQYLNSELRCDAVPVLCKKSDAKVTGDEGLGPPVPKGLNFIVSKEGVAVQDESSSENSHGVKRLGDESSAVPSKILRTEASSAPFVKNYTRKGRRSVSGPVSNENSASNSTVAEKDSPSGVSHTIPVLTGKRFRNYIWEQSCPLYSLDYSEQKEDIEVLHNENGPDITLRSSFYLRLKSITFQSLQTEDYTDVVLVCGTEKIRTHKLVLSAFSDFLKGLLLETDGEEDAVIILDEFEYVDIVNAIGLLYNGVILLKTASEAAMVQSVLNELRIKLPMGNLSKNTSKPRNGFSEKISEISSEVTDTLPEDDDTDVLEALGNENLSVEAQEIVHSAKKPKKRKASKNLKASCKKNGDVAKNVKKDRGQCRFCPEKFPEVSLRLKHERTHPDAHQACEKCGEMVFIGKRAAHLRTHREYICELCGKVVWYLQGHLRDHHGEEFVCDICNKKLSNRKRLDLHKEVYHGDRKVYPCELCVIGFKTKEELDEHDKNLHSRNKCPVCHLTLTKEQYRHFRKHLFTHAVKEVETVVQIQICGVEFFKCPRCNRLFSRSDYLENHLIGHYWPQWKIECTKCFMVFERSVILSRHAINCAADKPKRKPREYSSQRYGDGSKPGIKMFKNSAGIRYYRCPKCPKTHKSWDNANIHLQTVHNNKTSCIRCHKIFDSKEKRKEHMSIHRYDDIKRPCVLCSKMISGVRMKFHLIAHSKIEARTLSSPVCPRCLREFSAMSHVHNHLLRHYQPQRVLECPHCFLAVRNETDLNLHLQRCEAIFGKKKRIRKRPTKKQEFEMLWDCSECHLTFQTQEECELHIEFSH